MAIWSVIPQQTQQRQKSDLIVFGAMMKFRFHRNEVFVFISINLHSMMEVKFEPRSPHTQKAVQDLSIGK